MKEKLKTFGIRFGLSFLIANIFVWGIIVITYVLGKWIIPFFKIVFTNQPFFSMVGVVIGVITAILYGISGGLDKDGDFW